LQNIYNIIMIKTFFLQVFKGFSLHYHGPTRSRESHNLKTISHNPKVAKLKIQKSCWGGSVGLLITPLYYLYKSHHWV
jgi:hypothetical protein